MGKSKIIYAGETLIDLTGDTVTANKLEKGITAHGADGEQITGTATKKLIFSNITVPASAFSANSTYSDYPYRASVARTGVTSTLIPYVFFSENDAESGVLSRNVNSYNGGVYIYANEQPSSAIVIDKLICIE